MNHESLSRHETPQGSSDRSFGLVFSAFFFILATLSYFSRLPRFLTVENLPARPYLSQYPILADHPLVTLYGVVGLIFLIVAIILPQILAPLNWVWTKFGLLLHRIVSPIVLAVVFFLVLTPIGLIMRFFGADPLRLKFDPSAKSYWIERSPPGPSPDTLRNQF